MCLRFKNNHPLFKNHYSFYGMIFWQVMSSVSSRDFLWDCLCLVFSCCRIPSITNIIMTFHICNGSKKCSPENGVNIERIWMTITTLVQIITSKLITIYFWDEYFRENLIRFSAKRKVQLSERMEFIIHVHLIAAAIRSFNPFNISKHFGKRCRQADLKILAETTA